ncbi:MAG: helix-turn-helix domain-containing protein [Candidatus Acidiferrales bacterium]
MSAPDYARIPLGLMRHPQISPAAKLLYARLLLYAGKDGRGCCNPSHKTLAAEIAATDRHVRRLLDELSGYGLVEWKRTRKASKYRVRDLIPRPVPTEPSSESDRFPQDVAGMSQRGAGFPPETGQKCPIRPDVDVQSRPDVDVRQKDVYEKRSLKTGKESLSLPAAKSAAGFGGVLAFITETLNSQITESATKRLSQQLREIPLSECQMVDALREAIARAPKPPRTLSWFSGTLRQHVWERNDQVLPPAARPERMDQEEIDRLAEAFGG